MTPSPSHPHADHRTSRTCRTLVALAATWGVTAGAVILPSPAQAEESAPPNTLHLSSKQPYVEPSASDIAAYSPAPTGYTVVQTQSLGRHGSRGLSSYKYDALLMQMALTADTEGAFVSPEVRDAFFADLEAITAANVDNGYGMLTGQGVQQQQGIGTRAFERNRVLFTAADLAGDPITVESSGEARATESGTSFVSGLVEASGGSLADNVSAMGSDPDLLYFHKIENPDGSEKQPGTTSHDLASAYQDYIEAQTDDGGTIAAAIDFIEAQPRSEESARDLLSGIFTEEFVDSIGSDGHVWYNTADGSKNGEVNCAPDADPAQDPDACGEASKRIKTPVDASMDLYNLLIIGADMESENTGAHSFDFTKYFAGHEADTEWFAYLLDAEDFYEKGPSLEGHDETYVVAQPLLEDFFSVIDQRMSGEGAVATFRFAHAETIVPFSALIAAPGSTQHAPDVAEPQSMDDVYTYENNEWRGESVTPMSANIQWDAAVREGIDPATGAAYTPVVRMLLDEVEVPFNASCAPVAEGSNWYKESELKRCLSGLGTDEDPRISADGSATPTPDPSAGASAGPSAQPTTGSSTGPAIGGSSTSVPASTGSTSDTTAAQAAGQAGQEALAQTGSGALGIGVLSVLALLSGAGALAVRRVRAGRS
jgi:Histidine acid phosphatase.